MSDDRGAALLLQLKLRDRLREAGFCQELGVSQAGRDLVSRAAQRHGLPEWDATPKHGDAFRRLLAAGHRRRTLGT